MINLVTQIVDWNNELYVIKRVLQETKIKEEFVQEYKEYLGADTVLKKNGIYYFVEKVLEPELELVQAINP